MRALECVWQKDSHSSAQALLCVPNQACPTPPACLPALQLPLTERISGVAFGTRVMQQLALQAEAVAGEACADDDASERMSGCCTHHAYHAYRLLACGQLHPLSSLYILYMPEGTCIQGVHNCKSYVIATWLRSLRRAWRQGCCGGMACCNDLLRADVCCSPLTAHCRRRGPYDCAWPQVLRRWSGCRWCWPSATRSRRPLCRASCPTMHTGECTSA